ncbi:MAG: T9SS type A sorting domain-containing protein [Cytophagaceae bacterium]|nr:T9SS type A sorting domain-containing protein [Cytophagaceae bacterium]
MASSIRKSQVKATGYISQNSYHFEDTEANTGIVYYRIAQYDIDGAYTYSAVRSIHHNKTELLVYPTKHNGQFNLKLSSMSLVNRPVDVYLFSTMGAEVYHSKHQSTLGNLDADINITDLSSGVYLIKVSTDESIYTSKCIKE